MKLPGEVGGQLTLIDTKDAHLLECVTLCHPETLRTLRWTVTKLKQSAPQVLTS